MSTETNANPKFTEQPAQLYDPSTGKVVAQKAYNVAHDTTYDIWYGDPATGSGGGGGSGAVTDLTASGTISAAQPSINTPVTSASVSLVLGTGQSTFRAMLSNGGGGFTSGTTIVVDKSPDGGTTWFSSSFKVSGANPDTPVSSIVGPGPLQLVGSVAGATHVKVRCSVLNSTETIAVRIDASVGVSEVGIMAPLPAGPNNIGSVNVANGNANGQATMANSAPVVIASDQSKLPTKAASGDYVAGSIVDLATIAAAVVSNLMQSNTAKIAGQVPTLDNTTIQAVSMRGKGTVAGDTAILLDANGNVKLASQNGTWTNVFSTTQTGVSSWTGSGDLSVGQYSQFLINVNITAITGTSIAFKTYRKDSFGNVINLQTFTALTTTGTTPYSIGTGSTSVYFVGNTMQVQANFTSITSITFTLDVFAR